MFGGGGSNNASLDYQKKKDQEAKEAKLKQEKEDQRIKDQTMALKNAYGMQFLGTQVADRYVGGSTLPTDTTLSSGSLLSLGDTLGK